MPAKVVGHLEVDQVIIIIPKTMDNSQIIIGLVTKVEIKHSTPLYAASGTLAHAHM